MQKKIGHLNSVEKNCQGLFFNVPFYVVFRLIFRRNSTLESGVEPLLVVIILLEKVLARDGNSSVWKVTPSK